jgi:hypothetical protein
MVAGTLTTAERFAPPPGALVSGRWRLFRFTRTEAEALVRLGILPEDSTTELLNGMIVLKDCSAREKHVAMPPPEPVVSRQWHLFRFTRSDADAMVRMHIVPEDASTELLHGVLVHTDRSKTGEDPLTVGSDHTVCVEALSDLRLKINSPDRHVRSQQPLICGDYHEPQPDFMVLRRTLKSYTGKPTAADAFCVVEVADSSYERDTGDKLFGYARAGIVQYIIINLRNRTAEVYTNPDSTAGTYPPAQIIPADGTLSLRIGEAEMFPLRLRDVLP